MEFSEPTGTAKQLLSRYFSNTLQTKGDVKVFEKDITDDSYKLKVGYLPRNHRFPFLSHRRAGSGVLWDAQWDE